MLQISGNIKLVRALLGDNQKDFIKRFTGISEAMQKSYEGGKAKPGLLYLNELATLAGVSENDLLSKKLTKEQIRLNVEKGEKVEIKNPDQADQDFKDKYISLLEVTVKEKTELLKKVEFSLAQLPLDMGKLTDLILEGQELMAEKLQSDLDRKMGALNGKLDAIASSGSHKKPVHKGKH